MREAEQGVREAEGIKERKVVQFGQADSGRGSETN